jgi:transposase-like protein
MDAASKEREALLDEWRRGRFVDGLRCPRCCSRRVVRWGGFSGRLRFRCRGCTRTFSDLTGTPAAYLKKVELLPTYALCLDRTLPIRAAAQATGISASTAFRWRHRLLSRLPAGDGVRLTGWVELATRRFARSLKGQRKLARSPRRRGSWPFPADPVCMLVALDRRVRLATALIDHRVILAADLEHSLSESLDPNAALVADDGPYSPAAQFASRTGRRFVDARRRWRRRLANVESARNHCTAVAQWLRRFRGVATRYLRNYLAWHGWTEFGHRHRLTRRALHWCLPAVYSSTFPENRALAGRDPTRVGCLLSSSVSRTVRPPSPPTG